MPQTVQLNTPFEYTIMVTNVTDMMLTDVEVKERVPSTLKDLSSAPAVRWKTDLLSG